MAQTRRVAGLWACCNKARAAERGMGDEGRGLPNFRPPLMYKRRDTTGIQPPVAKTIGWIRWSCCPRTPRTPSPKPRTRQHCSANACASLIAMSLGFRSLLALVAAAGGASQGGRAAGRREPSLASAHAEFARASRWRSAGSEAPPEGFGRCGQREPTSNAAM